MGVFDFLKKKKDKKDDTGLKPVKGQTTPGSQQDMPDMTDVPRPPKPSENMALPKASSPNNTNNPPVPEPKKIEDEITPSPAQEGIKTPIPEPKAESKKPNSSDQPKEKTIDSQEPTKNSDDDFDFQLPDFTEEELKLEEKLQRKQQEERAKPSPEHGLKEKTESKVEEKDSEYSEEIITSAEPSALTKPAPEKSKKDQYLEVKNCHKIFHYVDDNKDNLKKTRSDVQKIHNKYKNVLEKYKKAHDDMDTIQEKLMKIDSVLFEG